MNPAELLTKVELSNIPAQLVKENYWITWNPIWSDAKEKFLKVPTIAAWQHARHPFPSSLSGHGCGFIYAASHPFVCVDVDDGSALNFRLVQELNSYAEWSPSQKGAHVIVATDNKQAIIDAFGTVAHNTLQKRDLFVSSGYCTITGRVLPIYADNGIRMIPHQRLIEILSPYFAVKTRTEQHQLLEFPLDKRKRPEPYAINQIMSALNALPVKYLPDNAFIDFPVIDLEDPNPPESRVAWLTVGQALHNLGQGDINLLSVWNAWSAEGDKFDEMALKAAWFSFGKAATPPVTCASILKLFYAQAPAYADLRGEPPRPMSTMGNVATYIKFAGITSRYNVITNEIEITLPPKLFKLLPATNVKAVAFLIDSEMHKHGTRSSTCRLTAQEMLIAQAMTRSYSPVLEYFEKLAPWDKRPRISELLRSITFQSTNYNQYLQYLRKWLIQVAAAVYTTPEKPNRLNGVLILQGEQGVGKTLWVESLFPSGLKQYCVGSKSVNMSQFRNDMVKLNMELTNTLICNVNEIDTVFNARTFSEFKQFLDNTLDKVVLPYGAAPISQLRRTVFIGSTNKHQIFSDHTGNRRFWLLNADSYDYKHGINIEQLWAEAKFYFLQGESWWLETDAEIGIQQVTNMQALATMDEMVLDKLNNMFDATKPMLQWQWYTFPQINTLLDLRARSGSADFHMAKRTITTWLKLIAPTADTIRVPRAQGTAWKCKLPPVKIYSASNDDDTE